MKDKNRVNKTVIKKIIVYCERIEEFIKRFGSTLEIFQNDFAFQMACSGCIIQIGELTTRISDDFKEKNSAIEWNKIKNFRNIHAHDYEKVDLKIFWEILTEEIPELKLQLQKILSEMQ